MNFRKIFWIVGIIVLIMGTSYVILPKPLYDTATWSDPVDAGVRKFQFSKYEVPENYAMVSYKHSLYDNKKFVLFQNQTTGQYFGIFILRELPKVDFEKINFAPKKVEKTFLNRLYVMSIMNDVNLQLLYFLPIFINEDYKNEYPKAEVNGFELKGKETFETNKTNVFLIEGKFEKLGFYRISDSAVSKYPMPIFSFRQSMNGAIAFINNKKTGETIFAFGCNQFFKTFDKDEFAKIVKTVTFDKEPKAQFGSI